MPARPISVRVSASSRQTSWDPLNSGLRTSRPSVQRQSGQISAATRVQKPANRSGKARAPMLFCSRPCASVPVSPRAWVASHDASRPWIASLLSESFIGGRGCISAFTASSILDRKPPTASVPPEQSRQQAVMVPMHPWGTFNQTPQLNTNGAS